MTTYGAYNAGLPCKNTSCKSHGKPHPNCRCYGADMAEGGEVKPFCSEDREHEPHCEFHMGEEDPHHNITGFIAHEGLHGLLKMHHHDPSNAMEKYDRSVKKGHKSIDQEIEKTFHGIKSQDLDFSKEKELIDEWISKGGVTHNLNEELYKQNSPENFAEGGAVKKKNEGIHGHPIEHTHPRQNMMLQSMKGNASNYLASLRPQDNSPKLAFDDAPDQTQAKKSYDRALGMAAHPMSVLDKIKRGTIEPEHIKHFNALHPELNNALQKKMTQKIIDMQLSGEKPSYKVRQGLSLFLGVPLSAEMTPANIQAAQAAFQVQGASPQASGGSAQPSKKSALAKTSQAYLTADDAAASRQQKQ